MSGGGSDNQTITTQNPPWLDQASQGVLGAAGQAYNGMQPNPLQTGAYATAGQWGSMAPGALGQAYNVYTDNANYQPNQGWLSPLASMLAGGMDMSSLRAGMGGNGAGITGNYGDPSHANAFTVDPAQLQQMRARSTLDYNINDYMNPFTTGVIDAQAGDIERARQLAGRNDAAQAMGAGAFGGSRSAIQNAVTNAEYDRNQASNSAQMRQAAYNDARNLIGQDIGYANNADAANMAQAYQLAFGNAGIQNANSQFNAGQDNSLTQTRMGADAQRASASAAASASAYAASLGAQNQRLSMLLQGAGQLGELGLGSDLNAATLRGNTAAQLQGFGSQGLGAMGNAGDAIYGQPFTDLSWYSNIVGNVPHGQSQSQPIYYNRGAGALGGAAAGAQMGSQYGGWGTAIGAGVGGLMGYYGSGG